MANDYQIGVTLANMEGVDALGLFPPLSDFTPFSATRQRGDGLMVGTGLPSFVWRFNELSLTQVGTLLDFLDDGAGNLVASNEVYARTRVSDPNMTDRVFRTYLAIMLLPFEPDDLRYDDDRKYMDVEVKFIHAVVQVVESSP